MLLYHASAHADENNKLLTHPQQARDVNFAEYSNTRLNRKYCYTNAEMASNKSSIAAQGSDQQTQRYRMIRAVVLCLLTTGSHLLGDHGNNCRDAGKVAPLPLDLISTAVGLHYPTLQAIMFDGHCQQSAL